MYDADRLETKSAPLRRYDRMAEEMARALRIEAQTLLGDGSSARDVETLRRAAALPASSLVRVFRMVQAATRND